MISMADELVGGAHQTEFRGERRPGPAGEQQRRDHRPELLQQRERGTGAERVLGPEALQQVVALQAEHHADEQAAGHDDDQRQRARVVDLLDDQPEAQQRTGGQPEQLAEETRHRPDALEETAELRQQVVRASPSLRPRAVEQLLAQVRRRVMKAHRAVGETRP